MTLTSDAELRRRGEATLLASWEAYARGARGAYVTRRPGLVAAVFPQPPESGIYNNALLADSAAIEDLEAIYRAAGVRRFAAWVREGDAAMAAELVARGYVLDTTTRAMGMPLDDLPAPGAELDLAPPDLAVHVHLAGAPDGLLAGADPADFDVVVARQAGRAVSTAIAHDHDGDRGIYNVGTLAEARRRGLGSAVTLWLARRGRARGCGTASLQATPEAERLYARLGFRDLGRILEYVPQRRGGSPSAASSRRELTPSLR